MDTIKLEKLPRKQDGRQHTSPLKYDKTDGPLFINVYLSVQKFTQNCTRRKWNKPENTRDITGCMGEIIQNWEPYLGTYKSFKNTETADIYIALHNTCNSNPDTGWFLRQQKQMDYWIRNYMVMRIQILDRCRLGPRIVCVQSGTIWIWDGVCHSDYKYVCMYNVKSVYLQI